MRDCSADGADDKTDDEGHRWRVLVKFGVHYELRSIAIIENDMFMYVVVQVLLNWHIDTHGAHLIAYVWIEADSTIANGIFSC